MIFLFQIYAAQEYTSYIGDIENVSPAKMTSMVTACLIPPKEILTQVFTALKHKEASIRHHGLEFLQIIMQQLNGLLAHVEKEGPKHPHYLEFGNSLREGAKKILPGLNMIFQCWQQATKTPDGKVEKVEEMEVDNSGNFFIQLLFTLDSAVIMTAVNKVVAVALLKNILVYIDNASLL